MGEETNRSGQFLSVGSVIFCLCGLCGCFRHVARYPALWVWKLSNKLLASCVDDSIDPIDYVTLYIT